MMILDTKNRNLTGPQRQLLLDHQRLGHVHMQRLQKLYNPIGPAEPDNDIGHGSPTGKPCLQLRFRTTSTCEPPLCEACIYSKARCRSPTITTKTPRPNAGTIPTALHQPGDLISVDHFESSVRGRLWHTRGQEKPHHRHIGGSIFYDHGSCAIFVYNQVFIGSSDTIRSKNDFEAFARSCGRTISRYHTDNGTFTSTAFTESLSANATGHQPLHTLSGVGAHHQNGAAERAIQTVANMARAMLLHCHLHWPDAFDPTLWPMALEYAAWIYNHIPGIDTTLAPMEIFTGSTMDCSLLRRVRVWGCPTYVLDPKLQDGKKLPKWSARSRQGQFLGFSPQHSTTIGMIRNLQTNYISPQFHCAYDEHFTPVVATWAPPPLDLWPTILTCDNYLDQHDHIRNGPLPPLDPMWQPVPIVGPALRPQPNEGENLHAARGAPAVAVDEVEPVPEPGELAPEVPPAAEPGKHEPLAVELGEPPAVNPAEPGEHEPPVVELGEPPAAKPGEVPMNVPPAAEPGEAPGADEPRHRLRRPPRRFPDPDRRVQFALDPNDSAWTNTTRHFLDAVPSPLQDSQSHPHVNSSPRAMALYINQVDWSKHPPRHSRSGDLAYTYQ